MAGSVSGRGQAEVGVLRTGMARLHHFSALVDHGSAAENPDSDIRAADRS